MKKYFKKLFLCSLFILINIFVISAQTKVVKVGWYDTSIPSEEIINGIGRGYCYEYLQALSQYTNWEYEYVIGSWNECLDWLLTGKIDILGFVNKTPEREMLINYPDSPMGVSSGFLVTSKTNKKYLMNDFSNFNSMKVGTVVGNVYTDEFKEVERKNHFSTNIIEFESFSEMLQAMKTGAIDAIIENDEDLREDEKILASFAPQNQYLAVAKNRKDLIQELNKATGKLIQYCPSIISDLRKKYFALVSDGNPIFTTEEQEFINKNRYIKVLYDAGWPPIEYWDEKQNKYCGISPDIFDLIAQKTGFTFIYDGSTSSQVLTEMASLNPENAITTISYDYIWAANHKVRITQPFISSAIVKFGKNLKAEHPKVAINSKAYFTYLLADFLKDKETIHFSKQMERIEAANSKEVDYTICTVDQANYYKSIPKYRNLQIEEIPGYSQEVCISVSQKSDPVLIGIISKAIDNISHDEFSNIVRKNTENLTKFGLTDLFYLYPLQTISVLLIVLLFIFILVLNSRTNKIRRKESDKANFAKSAFLSRMSHEIRTPLNGVIGMTDLALETEGLPEQALKYMVNVKYSGQYLLAIINDVLYMSKIESGKMKINRINAKADDLLQYIIPLTEELVKSRSIDFTYFSEKKDDSVIQIDIQHTSQIIINLLSNAIKYTPSGGAVHFTLKTESLPNGKVKHTYIISDNGIGMSKEFQETMFSAFTQESRSTAIQEKGTGLGLSIVKSLVDLMQGTIKVESDINKGSTFVVTIEYDKAKQTDIDKKEQGLAETSLYNLLNVRILLCEDNNVNAEIVTLQLQKRGIIVDRVSDGKSGVTKFEENPVNYYSTILMDVHMPIMGGLEATRVIRMMDREDAKKIPIVALTADAYDDDVKVCLNAGMNTHLAKPIEPQILLNKIVELINQNK